MSPAEQQFLAKAIKAKIQESADMRRKQLLAADAEATSASVQDALRATSTAAGIAGQVQEKDATAKLYKTQMEQQKYAAFMQDIGEAAEFVGDVYMANEEIVKAQAQDRENSVAAKQNLTPISETPFIHAQNNDKISRIGAAPTMNVPTPEATLRQFDPNYAFYKGRGVKLSAAQLAMLNPEEAATMIAGQ